MVIKLGVSAVRHILLLCPLIVWSIMCLKACRIDMFAGCVCVSASTILGVAATLRPSSYDVKAKISIVSFISDSLLNSTFILAKNPHEYDIPCNRIHVAIAFCVSLLRLAGIDRLVCDLCVIFTGK